jgi:outer membrane murein-binding lipoprotein Lpp
MKTKLQTLIAKFLGIESTIQTAIEAKVEFLQRDYNRAIEEISDETNSRINEVEDAASKVDDIESNVEDLTSKVDDIESAEYVSADWVTDEIESAKSDLSDEITEKVTEAMEEVKTDITEEQVEEILKRVLTKELILQILAK